MKRRFLALFLLGFSSGLPFCLVGSTLQAWFSVSAMSIIAVGMLGLIGQPYVYKFLWAPWMDRFSIGQSDKRRGWIFLTQTGLISLLFILSFLTPAHHPVWMAVLALIMAFFSASQDTVIDAYRAEILPEKERGLGAAVAVAGYRGAILSSGGLALIMAQYWGWELTYQCMAILMLLGVFGNYFAPRIISENKKEVSEIAEKNVVPITLWTSLRSLFQQKLGWQCVLFIVLYKIGEAFTSTTSSLSMPFLLQGLHFDLATVGVVNKIAGIASAILGSLIAGIVMLRISLFRALLFFGIGQAFSALMFFGLACTGHNLSMLIASVVIENLTAGMSTTALLAFMMGLCHRRFTAAHFAFLSAVAALPRMIAGPVGGVLQALIGWKILYAGVFFATWPGLIWLYYLFSSERDEMFNIQHSLH